MAKSLVSWMKSPPPESPEHESWPFSPPAHNWLEATEKLSRHVFRSTSGTWTNGESNAARLSFYWDLSSTNLFHHIIETRQHLFWNYAKITTTDLQFELIVWICPTLCLGKLVRIGLPPSHHHRVAKGGPRVQAPADWLCQLIEFGAARQLDQADVIVNNSPPLSLASDQYKLTLWDSAITIHLKSKRPKTLRVFI